MKMTSSSGSIVSNRLSVTALENYRRLVFRLSDNDDMVSDYVSYFLSIILHTD